MHQVLLVGSPNSGKSLLFNRLTGLSQKVANFPGVTVELRSGLFSKDPSLQIVDFPGAYSVHPLTKDEQVAIDAIEDALKDERTCLVVCVLDLTRLERSLVSGLQLLKRAQLHQKQMIFVGNMADELSANKLEVDIQGLSDVLGSRLLRISARTREGLAELESILLAIPDSKTGPEGNLPNPKTHPEFLAHDDALLTRLAHDLSKRFGPKGDLLLKSQYRLDQFLLSSRWGFLAFFAIMYLLFQSIFSWSKPMMDGIEWLLGSLAAKTIAFLPEGFAADFTKDAVFGGIGSFVVFVPQIFILSFIVGFLEDSGYLARAAVLCHRPLRFFGLTGKSFVPMLSGYACAIPALYAARTIDSPKKRFLTYLAIPLMACSARLPVYALLIAALIPAKKIFGGLLGLQGLVFFLVYLFGLIVALLVTGLLSRLQKNDASDTPFVLEIPPYRLPMWRTLLRHSFEKAMTFLKRAGWIIFIVTVVIWFLGYMPNGGKDLASSWLAKIGFWLEPLVRPLGLNWIYAVAILTSFLAREVFVGTLGTLLGIESADENIASLAERLQSSGLSLASGLALLAFYAVALQCVATVAVIKRESGSWKLPLQLFVCYALLGYLAAWIVYRATLLFTAS